ncbi:MAG: hypothetical protein BroJett011_13320 [Chloroflexota bacterium]|nr:MAG: hypothetical protein BroJett011_13320 [Chloroflexota bacterium]
METERKFNFRSWLRSPTGLILLAFLVIAVFYLVTEHTAHVFGFLPYALLLLCPLLHLFMHGGHNGHDGHNAHAEAPEAGLTAGGQRAHGEHSGRTGQVEIQDHGPAGGKQ